MKATLFSSRTAHVTHSSFVRTRLVPHDETTAASRIRTSELCFPASKAVRKRRGNTRGRATSRRATLSLSPTRRATPKAANRSPTTRIQRLTSKRRKRYRNGRHPEFWTPSATTENTNVSTRAPSIPVFSSSQSNRC